VPLLAGLIGGRQFIRLDAIDRPGEKTAGIQHVAGTEFGLRPARPSVKLDSQEISDFPKNAVFDNARKLAIGVADVDGCTERDRPVHLQAGAGDRNILKIGDATPFAAVGVLPVEVHQVGT